MKDSRLQFVLVIGLLILLGILAFFQYKWVGQISEAEQERLQKRLEIDSQYFAEDFNKTLQNAYFTFQFTGENWEQMFLEHYRLWQQNSPYPHLIKEFTVLRENNEWAQFDPQSNQFVNLDVYTNLDSLKRNFDPINEHNLTLTMPVYAHTDQFIFMRQPMENIRRQGQPQPLVPMPEIIALLVIKLDENVIKNQIFTDLSKKYFPDDDYKFSVISKKYNEPVLQTANLEKSDMSVPMFELMPESLAVFVNKDLLSTLNSPNEKKQVIFNQRFEGRVRTASENANKTFKVQVMGDNQNRILQTGTSGNNGRWILNVQHKAGSLEQFVGSSRRRNLLISFGILGLLGGSIGLIFLSARRAQVLAQRQLDFVSAVSHEFRTPIAVIYSAAENLADGVAREEKQVSRYGGLIKGEGKKLSAMVEQILEFAGARSGHKKYDFRETDVKKIIESALSDCQPLIAEKHFEVETEIQENLPVIQADSNSLSHAIQNLIINAVKYSNGSHWLKISAKNGDGTIKIDIEDKGIGISKKDLKQVFTPFYRAKDVVDAQIHGNGLGLSLVKQTVDAHHGKIEVESEIGKGSRFRIQLPVISSQKVKKSEN